MDIVFLHESWCSSDPSLQSLSPSQVILHGIQRPFEHEKSYKEEQRLTSTRNEMFKNLWIYFKHVSLSSIQFNSIQFNSNPI